MRANAILLDLAIGEDGLSKLFGIKQVLLDGGLMIMDDAIPDGNLLNFAEVIDRLCNLVWCG